MCMFIKKIPLRKHQIIFPFHLTTNNTCFRTLKKSKVQALGFFFTPAPPFFSLIFTITLASLKHKLEFYLIEIHEKYFQNTSLYEH
jgi:hypothetical protein